MEESYDVCVGEPDAENRPRERSPARLGKRRRKLTISRKTWSSADILTRIPRVYGRAWENV